MILRKAQKVNDTKKDLAMKKEYRLQYKAKISKKEASEKIYIHAKFGKHMISFRPTTPKDLDTYFLQRGVNPSQIIEECRNPKRNVPEFENLIGPTWDTSGGWGLVESDGEVIAETKEPSKLIWSTYEDHFQAACSARDRAVSETSVSAFQECLSQGFASIEAFLNTIARNWNKQNPERQLTDSRSNKVSLETKLDEWLPLVSGGKKIDKSSHWWNDFKKLKRLRDDHAIHPKQPGYSMSYKELANNINSFRSGIASLLGNMHLLIGGAIPAQIINAVYQPDVEVVQY